MKLQTKQKETLILITWIATACLILIAGRLGDHVYNFTPTIAIALVAGYLFKKKSVAIATIITAMLISDFVIGMDSMFMRILVYGSLIVSIFLGSAVEKQNSNAIKKSRTSFLFQATRNTLFGALVFFLVTNAGVWATSGMYTLDLTGFVTCYINAIPFFKQSLYATGLYAFVFFTALRFVEMKQTEKTLQSI